MAKCVQLVGQGVPIRVDDDYAFQLVHTDKDASYCPRRVWRAFYAPPHSGDHNPHLPRQKYTAKKGR